MYTRNLLTCISAHFHVFRKGHAGDDLGEILDAVEFAPMNSGDTDGLERQRLNGSA